MQPSPVHLADPLPINVFSSPFYLSELIVTGSLDLLLGKAQMLLHETKAIRHFRHWIDGSISLPYFLSLTYHLVNIFLCHAMLGKEKLGVFLFPLLLACSTVLASQG